ncbi:MAG: hypothetical protein AB7V50_08175 [Vampirovibrionia bacterium]
MKFLFSFIIGLVFIITGIFSGISLFTELRAESYVNGSIDITNQFSMSQFEYAATSLTFYHELYDTTNTYWYEIDLLKVDEFNGAENTYQVFLNNYLLIETAVLPGAIESNFAIDFYNTSGNITASSTLSLNIQFLSNKSVLRLETIGTDNAAYLSQYFTDNGIKIEVKQIT